MTADVVRILQDLIRCPSVTPVEGGAIDYLENLLKPAGFSCHRLTFGEVDNLYVRFGTALPHFCFAGHTDVVPVGDEQAWSVDPFGGVVRDGFVWGRGAVDMKGGVAAFAAAALDFIAAGVFKGSISFLITGDEEGPAVNGTVKVLEWLKEKGEKIDFCVVGEPTSRATFGDMAKIGRRGTLTGRLQVIGKQGHSAYPHLADNPVPKLVTLLKALDDLVLDDGTPHFQPSNLQIVNVDVGNAAENVIPAAARAVFNVRFNDLYTGAKLEEKLRTVLDACGLSYTLQVRVGGESFYTPPGKYSDMIADAVKSVTGAAPELSTTGGTSDARFIRAHCPVIEFGPVGQTAHQVDERIAVKDLEGLRQVYLRLLRLYFQAT